MKTEVEKNVKLVCFTAVMGWILSRTQAIWDRGLSSKTRSHDPHSNKVRSLKQTRETREESNRHRDKKWDYYCNF